ncbi:MATE family efflux transporter [Oceanibium sediminis]|uniref:MATE family efflux transporter n=1 Tax=Oceanibium sediminis TaxID=2026339 RepID=UPI001E3BC9FE|nr:MATE family efflux transporter [Oceanibium sediminis]
MTPKPLLPWSGHFRATMRLAMPLVGAFLAQQSLQLGDTIMLGWLGAEPLAAGVLGSTFWFMGFIIAVGFSQVVMPMVASAEGEGDIRGVRRATRMGLWAVTIVMALLLPLYWQTEAILLAFGQEPELAALADDYLGIAMWALFPAAAVLVLRAHLSALERPGIVLWIAIAGAILNLGLNWALIFGNFGAPQMGIRGAATATLITNIVMTGMLVVYALWQQDLRKYNLFVRFYRPDWGALREVFVLGLPVAATLLAEFGLFAGSTTMMGWLGTVPLAAHGIALQITSVFFMVPLGIMSAGTIRVGNAYGRRDPVGLDRAAKTVLIMGLAFALFAALVLLTVPGPLVSLFLDRDAPEVEAILAMGVSLLAVAAIFQLVDIAQVISAGLLRGIKDTRRPMVIAITSYWVIGLPVAYVLGFPLGWGGAGVWAGMAIGLAYAAVMLTLRFMRRAELGLV